jgi:hypothetical protein
MAIRIPILTSFDPKGLRQANAQFAKLQTSVGSLGRNFAAAGVAIAAAGALIAKNAQSLARIERINAQTEQTIKSMGNTAGISAQGIEQLAGSLENLTATEAETIQEGANLLLTFKNITNQAGAGNDIFNQTTAAMVDLARAMGTSASGEAIRLGKALNDPIRGVASLTRVGVSFTEEQRAQIKALQESGNLMGAQKIILAELQSQFGGSGAAFAKTFTGQLELMGHELGTIGEEATMAVMPALQGMVGQLRELIPVIGPQLKAAIESVDWKALTQDVVNLATFFIKNATAIVQVTATIFAINTAFKAMQVAMGIVNVALAVKAWWLAKVATGMTTAAIATGVFSTALKLIPFVAIAAGFGLIIAGITETDSSYRTTTPVVTSFGQEVLKTGHDAEWAAGKYGVLKSSLDALPKNVKINVALETTSRNNALENYLGFLGGRAGSAATAPITAPTISAPRASSGGGSQAQTVSQVLQREGVLATRETKLLSTGISAGFANLILNTATTKKAFQKELAGLTKSSAAATKAQAKFNKTSAGRAEIAQNAAAASAAASAAAAEMAAAQEAAARAAQEAADREAAIVAERERVFQSFADSVKSTFAGIKNSILGAFDLGELGGSTNAITRNMDKLLVRLRAFATNVKSLAGMGLDPALLQQVISAGPMAGARLAETLVMGGTGALAAINAGYSEFGVLSGQIAQTGTESLFNRESQQTVYNINVDGGVGSGSTIGKAIVDAIKAYERTSGAVWQGA